MRGDAIHVGDVRRPIVEAQTESEAELDWSVGFLALNYL